MCSNVLVGASSLDWKWEDYMREAWKRQVWKVTSWTQVRGPGGAALCEMKVFRITVPLGSPEKE